MSYVKGVYDDENCDSQLNHSMTLVGYGNENGSEYWIAQNSWGDSWGEKGYIRVAVKPGDGICGIQTNAVWTVLV